MKRVNLKILVVQYGLKVRIRILKSGKKYTKNPFFETNFENLKK